MREKRKLGSDLGDRCAKGPWPVVESMFVHSVRGNISRSEYKG